MTREKTEPGPGQESVWDYPRPPAVQGSDRHIQIVFNGATIVDTRDSHRVLETSHPPVYYVPRKDVVPGCLEPTDHATTCEWKGRAVYFTVVVGSRRAENAAWSYPDPKPGFEAIAGAVAFYPGKMDACLVDGVRAEAQPSDFYGGWITPDIVGPFKGGPGTRGW